MMEQWMLMIKGGEREMSWLLEEDEGMNGLQVPCFGALLIVE